MRRSNSRMAKMWKSIKTSISLSMTGTALAIPQHSKILLVGTSGMLPKRFFARNYNMILVPTMGLCRASILFPLMSKVWSWKVKESELLQKNVSLPSTIPLMVPPWGKLPQEDVYAFHATIVLRYCHNPQI